MSSRRKSKAAPSKVQVQDALHHNPFADLFGGGSSTSSEEASGPGSSGASASAGSSKSADVPASSGAPASAGSSKSADAPASSGASAASTGASEDTWSFAPKVVVSREHKGRGGKTVTRLRGAQGSDKALGQLAREIGKALGARAFVEEGQVLVSGDQTRTLENWLRDKGARKVVRGN